MTSVLSAALPVLVALLSLGAQDKASLCDNVNPFVGTAAHGHTFPGAAFPFGMMQLSPDTRPDPGDWDGCSGYHYSDSLILGFSHTHLSGTGCSDLCDVLVMPAVGYTADTLDSRLYSSPFSHSREKASPGYYEVFLEKPQVTARMTVSERTGMHDYTFPAGVTPQIVIDLKHRDRLIDSELKIKGNVVYGKRESKSWSKDQSVYFAMIFSEGFKVRYKSDTGAVLDFPMTRAQRRISIKVGISSVSAEGAMLNLMHHDYENFNDMALDARDEWERFLETAVCPFSDERQKRIFYTALYHCAIHPSVYSDADGRYRGMDGRIWETKVGPRYTVFSLWDTFRGLHPLLAELSPDLAVDFINSMISVYVESGRLPVWELQGYETDCMIGYHSASVIADALARGLDGFDVKLALKALLASSRREDHGLGSFRRNGLVIADDEHESVSKTLEYAYDDWCVAQVAKYLMDRTLPGQERDGYAQIYDSYMTSAQYWRNVFDPSTGFMRARLNGCWLTPFDPRQVNNHYTEGNAWQYSFFVPHDVVGLMRAQGGPSKLCAKMDSLFSAPSDLTGRDQVDITGRIGQYAHGNEPSHHIPWLYALCGRPERGKEVADRIMSELYSDGPDGLCGNDDCGQMSAWYVLSALGRYPVCPGTELGSLTYVPKTITVNPVFDMPSDRFRDSMSVSVKGEGRLFYSIDSSVFVPYEGPFTVRESCKLRAYAVLGGTRSFTTVSTVSRVRADRTVSVISTVSDQYTAGGAEALIDGIRGGLNWRTGGWQGYQMEDFCSVVDLLEQRTVSSVGAGFLQDQRSWIWMPQYVEFFASSDGVNYKRIAHIDHLVDTTDETVRSLDFSSAVDPLKARYIKVCAKQLGTIPQWHPGAGGKSFIFIDEIWID